MTRHSTAELRDMFPTEFPTDTADRRYRVYLPVLKHKFSDVHFFLVKVTQCKKRERIVTSWSPTDRRRGLPPHEAKSYYYVNDMSWWRLYSVDFTAGELQRRGQWDERRTADQWLRYAANDPLSTVPPTRPRMADGD